MKKLQEEFMDDESSGVLDSYSIVPQVVEAIGFFQATEDGMYNVDAESEHMMSLQIGPGLETKSNDLSIDRFWNIMDTRVNRTKTFELKAGLYYPFRLVIVYSDNESDVAISQSGPNNEPIDFLGIWETVEPTASASNGGGVEEQTQETEAVSDQELSPRNTVGERYNDVEK